MGKALIRAIIIFMAALLVCCACAAPASTAEAETAAVTASETASVAKTPYATLYAMPSDMPTDAPEPTPEPVPETAEIGFVGDIMMMTSQISEAKTGEGYDFTPSFEYLLPLFTNIDLMCGNFECTLAGEGAGYTQPRATMEPATEANPSPTKPPFQRFNAPDELAENLVAVGFDVLSTVNNHSMDKGIDGLYRTAQKLREAGAVQLGTYIDENDAGTPRVVEVNGFKVGFVAATDVMNRGVPGLSEEERGYALVRLENTEKLESMIKDCRKAGAEIVIAIVHWGIEYADSSNGRQREYAEALIEAGADAIMGSHPHVVQEARWIECENGRKAPVVYSMGNFLSNMTKPDNEYGVFVRLTLARDAQGRALCSELAYLPLLCYRDGVRKVEPCFEESEGRRRSAFLHVRDTFGGENIILMDSKETARYAR